MAATTRARPTAGESPASWAANGAPAGPLSAARSEGRVDRFGRLSAAWQKQTVAPSSLELVPRELLAAAEQQVPRETLERPPVGGRVGATLRRPLAGRADGLTARAEFGVVGVERIAAQSGRPTGPLAAATSGCDCRYRRCCFKFVRLARLAPDSQWPT